MEMMQKQRDTRIDVLRALALLSIFINHVPGTIYERITHKNFGFSDATEAFVLISGIAVALAYGHRFDVAERFLSTIKMWRRVISLYLAHIFTTLVTLAMFCATALIWAKPQLLEKINIAPLINKPAEALLGLVTLGHQLGYNNILSLYMVLMLVAPLIIWGARKNMALTLFISGAVWLLCGLYNIAPPNYPNKGVWFLNPFSWQFLFTIGIVATLQIKSGKDLFVSNGLTIVALIYVVVACIWVRGSLWFIDTSFGLPRVLTGFNKTYLSAPRLLHVLALAYLLVALPRLANFFRVSPLNPLAILGRHGLAIFVMGTIASMLAQLLRYTATPNILYDSLLIVTGIAVQFAFAYYLEWLRLMKKGQIVKKSIPSVAPLSNSEPLHNVTENVEPVGYLQTQQALSPNNSSGLPKLF